MALNLVRNSRVFFTTNVDSTGKVNSTGFLPGNTAEVQVLDGFSFSQNTSNETVTVSEAGTAPIRGQRSFNTALEPASFSFSSYLTSKRLNNGVANLQKMGVEEAGLWNALMGNQPLIDMTAKVTLAFTGVASYTYTQGTPSTLAIAGATSLASTLPTLAVGMIVQISGIDTGVTLNLVTATADELAKLNSLAVVTAITATTITLSYIVNPSLTTPVAIGASQANFALYANSSDTLTGGSLSYSYFETSTSGKLTAVGTSLNTVEFSIGQGLNLRNLSLSSANSGAIVSASSATQIDFDYPTKLTGTSLTGIGPQNTFTSIVPGVAVTAAGTYTNVAVTSTSGSGTGAKFTIVKTGTGATYTSANTTIICTAAGSGYAIGNTVTITGASLGGVVTTNDLTFTISGTLSGQNITVTDKLLAYETAWVTDAASTEVNTIASNANQLVKFGMIFLVDQVAYALDNCVLNEATIDFGIDAIATVAWSGQSTSVREFSTSLTATTLNSALGKFSAGGYFYPKVDGTTKLTNKLSTCKLTYVKGLTDSAGAAITTAEANDFITVPLTGGSITINNNVTYLTPANLATVNLPVTYFTGARAVSGTLSAYLKTGSSTNSDQTGNLLADMLKAASSTVEPVIKIEISIGGSSYPNRIDILLPTTVIGIPSVDVQQVVSTSINFNAQGYSSYSGVNAYDIEKNNDINIKYYSA